MILYQPDPVAVDFSMEFAFGRVPSVGVLISEVFPNELHHPPHSSRQGIIQSAPPPVPIWALIRPLQFHLSSTWRQLDFIFELFVEGVKGRMEEEMKLEFTTSSS